MNQTQARTGSQGVWIAGLAALSLAMPLLAVWLRLGSADVPAPGGATDYRLLVAALAVAIAGGIGAVVGSRGLVPAWQRWLIAALAVVGILAGAYMLWSLVGLCGLQVLWDVCRA